MTTLEIIVLVLLWGIAWIWAIRLFPRATLLVSEAIIVSGGIGLGSVYVPEVFGHPREAAIRTALLLLGGMALGAILYGWFAWQDRRHGTKE